MIRNSRNGCGVTKNLAGVLWLTVIFGSGCREQASPSQTAPVRVVSNLNQPTDKSPNSEPLRVRITGHDFQWRVRYPGSDGILDSEDDILSERHLHLPENRQIQLELCSDDFAYTLFVPHFDFLDVAIPASPYVFEFTTDTTGDHQLLGSQMCGYTHPLLIGRLIVHSNEDFESWLKTVR